MVEVKKCEKNYEQCTSCGSTDEVFFLKCGDENKTCVKLCNGCRGDVINLFKEITDAW